MKKYSVSLILVSLLLLVSAASAQKPDMAQKLFKKLKVGEWIKVEGIPQKNFTVLLREIELIYGEVEDDDWEISGRISTLDPKKKMMYVLNLPVKIDDNIEYDDDYEIIKSFSDIKPGLFVELEGTYLKDGTFLGTEIGTADEKAQRLNKIEWTGKVQEVDPTTRTITMLGHNFVFTPSTKIKSLIQD